MKHISTIAQPRIALTLTDYSNIGYCYGFAKAEPKRDGGPEVPEACAPYLEGKIKLSN